MKIISFCLFYILLSTAAFTQCEESIVLTTESDSIVFVCPGDGQPDLVGFSTSSIFSENYDFILTDGQGEIITVLPIPLVDFDGFFEGRCRVYGVSYSGILSAPNGEDISEISSDGACAILSDNYVEIIREIPVSGSISEDQGNDFFEICSGDGIPDSLHLNLGPNPVGNLQYLLIQQDSIIADIFTSSGFDAENLSGGISKLYGLAYSGTLLIEHGDTINLDTSRLSSDCYELSNNFLLLDITFVSTGTITDSKGRNDIYACAMNGVPDEFHFVSDDSNSVNLTYILTDQSQNIEQILSTDSIDFEEMSIGQCQIWAISYTGELLLSVGDVLDDPTMISTGCADICDQPIQVTKDIPVAPIIRDHHGQEISRACPGDGRPDLVGFQSLNDPKGFLQIILLTPDGLIIGLPGRNEADFENVGPGECHVRALSYTGELNIQVGTFLEEDGVLSTDCYALSENFVRVIRERLDGGTVSTVDSNQSFFACPMDGNPDILNLIHESNSGADYSYILIDTAGLYLGLILGGVLDIDGLAAGQCRAYGVSHFGEILAQVGDTLLINDIQAFNFAGICSELSDNFVSITKSEVDAGILSSSLGEGIAYLCTEPGSNPFVLFESNTDSDQEYQLIVVDENNLVINLPEDLIVDFRGISANQCRVYGLSYNGDLQIELGESLLDLVELSSACFDLSMNFVSINKDEAEGGTIVFEDETEVFNACNGDGRPDIAYFQTNSSSSLRYSYLLADNNLKFLNLIPADSLDFELFPPGQCLIVGASYSGNFNMTLGDDVLTDEVSDDCYEISSNFIVVSRQGFGNFALRTIDGDSTAFICPGTNGENLIEFDIDNPDGQEVLFLIDDQSRIQEISLDGIISLDPTESGICYAQSAHFSGSLRVEVGDLLVDTTTISSRCYSLSDNLFPIIKEEPVLDSVFSASGENTIYACPGDGIPNFLKLIPSNPVFSELGSVITSTNGIILNVSARDSFDVELFPLGECLIYGLAFTGNLAPIIGQDIAEVGEFYDDCWDLSENAIRIIKENPEAGLLLTLDGQQETSICVDDLSADYVITESFNREGSQFVYLYTDEQNVITAITITDSIDLDNAGIGTCRIYGLAFTGDLSISFSDDLDLVSELSTDCYDLTDNFIAVSKTSSSPSELTAETGDSSFYSCIYSEIDSFFVNSDGGMGSEMILVIVNRSGMIIRLTELTDVNALDGLARGEYEVYQLNYSGELLISAGETFDPDAIFSSVCYSLSIDPLLIIRDEAKGGSISYQGSIDTARICALTTNMIEIELNEVSDLSYAFILTNSAGRVLSVLDGREAIDVTALGQGIIGITGLSYSGSILVRPGDNILEVDLASGCIGRSSNRLWLNISLPFVESFLSNGSDSIVLCSNENSADTIQFDIVTESELPFALVLVNSDNQIVKIQTSTFLPNVELADGAECKIYAFSYSGMLLAETGDAFDENSITDGCYAVAQKPIVITKSNISGGTVQIRGGGQEIEICVQDEEEDLLRFESVSANGSFYSYIVTNATDRIVNFSFGGSFLFNDNSAGECRVYGIAHEEEFIHVTIGTNIFDNSLSEECFELTDNFVLVRKFEDGPLCVTATRDEEILGLSLFPNPTSENVTIQWNTEASMNIVLRDSHGREIRQDEIIGSSYVLNLGTRSSGIYWLELTSGNQRSIRKLVKK